MNPEERPYKAVLTGLDGVLRLRPGPETGRIEGRYGVAAGTIEAVALAPERFRPAVTGRVTDDEWRLGVAAELARQMGQERAVGMVSDWSASFGRIDPEVLALLTAARSHAKLALVANATTRLELDLVVLGVVDLFDAVVNSARIGVAKPAAAIYLTAAGMLGVVPQDCLYVDDSRAYVAGARRVGMTGLRFGSPAQLRSALGTLVG